MDDKYPGERLTVSIPIGPLKNMFKRAGDGAALSLGAFLAAMGIVLTAFGALLIAALMWWLSDLVYGVHWTLGFPVRVVAFIFAVSALFTALGAAFQLIVLLVAVVISMTKLAFGRS